MLNLSCLRALYETPPHMENLCLLPQKDILGFWAFLTFQWTFTYDTTIALHSCLQLQGKRKSTLTMHHCCRATRRTTVLFSPHCRAMCKTMGLLLFPYYQVISRLTNLFFPCCRPMRGAMGFVVSSLPGHVRGKRLVVCRNVAAPQFHMYMLAGIIVGDVCNSK